jgi:hypothetical protein
VDRTVTLNLNLAAVFVALPLRSLRREYPNHLMHALSSEADVRAPRALHPVFYGCYDWHSAVHGYWLLARCAAMHPALEQQAEIAALFDEHFTTANIAEELAYFEAPGRAAFERPYGHAWLLALSQALADWPRATAWHAALEPLVLSIRDRTLRYFPGLRYPIRVGTHYNSAFALKLALDFARHRRDPELADAMQACARRFYLADTDYPARYEPGGDEFLSAALAEALLMAEVLEASEFAAWFERFLPDLAGTEALLRPAEVSDRSDPKIAHLDGLNLSRAWCMRGIAEHVPSASPAHATLANAARAHVEASLPHVTSGHYAGEHWLATFGLLALSQAAV